MTYPKRLIEVDLPIKRISEHARRESNINYGHISTLHTWWARRPLAACRAVLCAALWLDPADLFCPPEFREAAKEQMLAFADKTLIARNKLTESMSSHTAGRMIALAKRDPELDLTNLQHLNVLRQALLDFIADFANWDNSTNEHYLVTARTLTQAAHEAIGGVPGTRPLVVDPFAGGGAIPLEALRVGADVFASDLNPVAVLLNKVVLELIPRYGNHLLIELEKYRTWIKEKAGCDLNRYYSSHPGETTLAYIWARTIVCEGPRCGCEVPLLRSLWLSKGKVALKPILDTATARIDFEILSNPSSKSVKDGFVKGGAATCPCCGFTTPAKRVKEQLSKVNGGAKSSRLIALYVTSNGQRYFRIPQENDIILYGEAIATYNEIVANDPDAFPSEKINPIRPYKNTRGLSAVTRIGCSQFQDLYNHRQLVSLHYFYRAIEEIDNDLTDDMDKGLANAIKTLLGLALGRLIYQNTSISRWDSSRNTIKGAFSKQALAVVWDYAEANPFSGGSADWDGAVDWIIRVIEKNLVISHPGQVLKASATDSILPADSVSALVTDPPYFAAIPYGDLSDFFYVWLRRSFKELFPDLFSGNQLVEKYDELIVTNAQKTRDGHNKDEEYFRNGMTQALSIARESVLTEGIGIVVYAEATTEGWEAILSALVRSGWIVTASWPIDTEMQNRTRAQDAASLQSSIHLVCRPRQNPDGSLRQDVGDWRDVLTELPHRIRQWLPRLEQEGVVGADAIFACLGPAMEIYSRYARVEKANGDVVSLSMFLEEVWAAVSREALTLIFDEADTSGFEEDARLTVVWFWALKASLNGNGNSIEETDDEDSQDSDAESSDQGEPVVKKSVSGYSMEYDTARKIAQGLGANLHTLSRPGGIVAVKGNLATLNSVSTREKSLIGFQLSLFGEDDLHQEVKTKRKRDVSVQIKDVANRQQRLFDEPIEKQPDDSGQLQLPTFKGQFEDRRTLMQRLLDSGETILDRLHQAMLLHGRGQTALLGVFLQETGMGADTRFWRLADSLLRLYPKNTEEYRWLDGLLARKKGLGF